MAERFTNLFPLWAVLLSAIAYIYPGYFTALKPAIVPLLGIVMFGMGMTLTPEDFARVLKKPSIVALGTALQFLVMPFIAWVLFKALDLPVEIAAGLVLVGSCPGGTASNVICYLSRGDVPLSITLTAVSTILAVAATPILTWFYIGRMVPVPVASMFISITKIVIVPVLLGVAINSLAGKRFESVRHRIAPAFSVTAIVLIIAIIVALNRENLAGTGIAVLSAVVIHNLLGLAIGYAAAGYFTEDEKTRRTIAIEVGMQNSGLGVALAVKYFSVKAALPGAVFSIWHNLSGSFLASWWSRRTLREAKETA